MSPGISKNQEKKSPALVSIYGQKWAFAGPYKNFPTCVAQS